MTDTAQWPLTATHPEVAVSEAQRQLMRFIFNDLPDVSTLPRLVFPAPLVDRALLERNEKEGL